MIDKEKLKTEILRFRDEINRLEDELTKADAQISHLQSEVNEQEVNAATFLNYFASRALRKAKADLNKTVAYRDNLREQQARYSRAIDMNLDKLSHS